MDSSSGHNKDEMRAESAVGPKAGKPQPEQALKCPRCESTNTKFCYYNNYSLTQPRYFCKSCRRYWTKGGTLRNVPVGGGCRKNRRSSSSAAANAKRGPTDHHHHNWTTTTNNSIIPSSLLSSSSNNNNSNNNFPLLGNNTNYDQNDLALAFARLQNNTNHTDTTAFLEALRSGFLDHHHHNHHHHHQSSSSSTTSSPSQNLYYGFGHNNSMGLGNNNNNYHDDHDQINNNIMISGDVATIKQELPNTNNSSSISPSDHDQQRMLWGYYPWQISSSSSSDHHNGMIIGNGNGNIGDQFDASTTAGRESWNGFGSSWHGLLNTTTPLV